MHYITARKGLKVPIAVKRPKTNRAPSTIPRTIPMYSENASWLLLFAFKAHILKTHLPRMLTDPYKFLNFPRTSYETKFVWFKRQIFYLLGKNVLAPEIFF